MPEMVASQTRVARGRLEIEAQPPVGGTVRLMTDEPIVVSSADPPENLREQATRWVSRRPWIFPAGFLAAAAIYLLLRRR